MKKLLLLATSALLFGGAVAVGAPKISVSAEEIVESSEELTSEEATSSAQSSTSEKDWIADNDGNGIPDEIENYYNNQIRDAWMFGIPLGTVIGGLMGLVTFIFNTVNTGGQKKTLFEIKAESNSNSQIVAEIDAEFKKYKEEADKQLEEWKAVAIQYKNEANALSAKFEEASTKLDKYSAVDNKLNASNKMVALLANTKEYTANGVNTEVQKVYNEVK